MLSPLIGPLKQVTLLKVEQGNFNLYRLKITGPRVVVHSVIHNRASFRIDVRKRKMSFLSLE